VILPAGTGCGCERPETAICRSLCRIRAKIQDRFNSTNASAFLSGQRVRRLRSVLEQCFADAALGELVLADDALGVDAQQNVHAVPGPFRDLGGKTPPFSQVDRQACRRS